MFKRTESNRESEYSLPAKRPKYDTKRGTLKGVSINNRESANKRNGRSDDIWGADFAEADIEEMDFVASQACLQEDNELTQLNRDKNVSCMQRYNTVPSSSKTINGNSSKISRSLYMSKCNIQRKEIEDSQDTSMIVSVNYKEFKDKLVNKKVYNSTFKLDDTIIEPEPVYAKELEKLKSENKKLLDDFITKEGEAVFLRNQLQQTQLRAENDKLEKTRFIEQQENRHRTEINAICKEKEHLKTQLELQAFEVGNLLERCKLLESGNVKLTEPHSINFNTFVNRNKCNSPVNRSLISSTKSIKVREACVQANVHNKSSHFLRIWNPYFPLAEIPKLIYDLPQPEKPIVDIQIIEKVGRRNLPILQEENTFRIFENPELVKPVTTIIDDKRLTVEYIFPEIAALQRKTNSELEAENTIPIINKLVSTSRELLLNIIIVLQTIFQAMKNDDIRDMNDVYFSELYSSSDFNGKSVCSASAWHEYERGVETRRIFGLLSYVTLESTYLSKHIAGKTCLLTERDEYYKCYSCQMVHYNTWSKKHHKFEILEMLLQFVILVGSTRRSHQFSGLICAIMMIICNVHKKVEYCSEGMEYIYRIFKEIVFARPLPYCYTLLCNIMLIFVKSSTYLRKLCVNSQSMAVNNWKGSLHFTPDACPLQIFLAQVENYHFDIIAAIDTTDILLQFVQYILHTDIISLRSETLNSCNCCMKLLRFTIKTMSKCSEANLAALGNFNFDNFPVPKKDTCNLKSIYKFSDENAWTTMKRRQSKILRDGIRFLSHLAICDPDFVIRLSEIEDSFHLFMRNLSAFDNFVLHENEQEAMNRIKQTFIFDKTLQSETEYFNRGTSSKQLDIMTNFERTFVQPLSTRSKKNENHNKVLVTFKSLFNSRMDFSNH
ncbi:ATR-interacting protein mus304 [Habropoda laboriosa]|uniref:ATR-interacting protein mus304 n=1 Tax=Habropoda laboriosa TaxID=597456 RepID=A0A0L7R2P0_9HYME|nr:ATR-interacting protein mus304 [Habropoda laboriosa]